MPPALAIVGDIFGAVVTAAETVGGALVKGGTQMLKDSPGMQLLSGGTPVDHKDIDGKEGTGSGTTSFNKNTTDNGNIDDPDTEEHVTPKHHKDHKHPKSDDPNSKKDSTKDTTFSFE